MIDLAEAIFGSVVVGVIIMAICAIFADKPAPQVKEFCVHGVVYLAYTSGTLTAAVDQNGAPYTCKEIK